MNPALVLDSNLLVLYITGLASKSYINSNKRLRANSYSHFVLLDEFISEASNILLTPNTVTERSNLLDCFKNPAERADVSVVLHALLKECGERYVPSVDACERPEFRAVGITDTVLLTLSTKPSVLLTSDHDLVQAAIRAGCAALNFTHEADNRGLYS